MIYAILGLAGGVFYREFTKASAFTGKTTLSVVHTHLILLGSIVFLLVGMIADRYPLESVKTFRATRIIYPSGLTLTVTMMLVRGILQVSDVALSRRLDAAVSGIAGICHILLGTGILLFFIALKKAVKTKAKEKIEA